MTSSDDVTHLVILVMGWGFKRVVDCLGNSYIFHRDVRLPGKSVWKFVMKWTRETRQRKPIICGVE